MEKKTSPPIHVLSLRYNSTEIPVRITRRVNQKHIRIRIAANGEVSLSAPLHTPLKEVQRVLARKEGWISTKLEELSGQIDRFDPLKGVFLNGEYLQVLFVEKNRHRFAARPDRSADSITVTGPYHHRGKIEAALAKLLRAEAREQIERQARDLSSRTGIPYRRLFLRNQRTRWGSSSSIGNISLNWRTVMLPPEVQHYLLVHELVHQRQLNHSPHFWKLVEELCPRYREHEKVLKQSQVLMGLFRS